MPDALIWGASGGIGNALVTQLKDRGWRVFAAARHDDDIPDAADSIYKFNAGDPDSITSTVTLCAHETDGVDLVIYAAGGLTPNPLEKLDPADWQATIDANLTGAYLTARSSLNLMTRGGHMMFLGAYVPKITLPRMGAYAVAKAGLETLVETLQKEHRKMNITLVRPPAVDTDFWQNVPFRLPESALTPDDVARAMLDHMDQGKNGTLDL